MGQRTSLWCVRWELCRTTRRGPNKCSRPYESVPYSSSNSCLVTLPRDLINVGGHTDQMETRRVSHKGSCAGGCRCFGDWERATTTHQRLWCSSTQKTSSMLQNESSKREDESQQIAAWRLLCRVQHSTWYLIQLQTIPNPDIERIYLCRPLGARWQLAMSKVVPCAPLGTCGSSSARPPAGETSLCLEPLDSSNFREPSSSPVGIRNQRRSGIILRIVISHHRPLGSVRVSYVRTFGSFRNEQDYYRNDTVVRRVKLTCLTTV